MSKRVPDLTSTETLQLRCSMGDLREAALIYALKPDHHNETAFFIAAHEFGETLNKLGLQGCYRGLGLVPEVGPPSDTVFDPNP